MISFLLMIVVLSASTFLAQKIWVMWPLIPMMVSSYIFSYIAMSLPKKSIIWEIYAGLCRIIGASLPLIVIIKGFISLYESINTDIPNAYGLAVYGCAWVLFGLFGLSMVWISLIVHKYQ